MADTLRADVAVVGLGTAGAAVTAACAARGLRVVGLDRRPLDGAGARWVNGVPAWAFERAGLEAPRGDELRGGGHAFHLVAGWEGARLTVRDHGVLEVDMRHLVERLHRVARERGARLVGDARVTGWEGVTLTTTAARVHARWVVDASGLGGAGLVPVPEVAPRDLCAAAQYVHRVADPAGARAFFEARAVALGETVCFTGIAGGYSILNLRSDGETVSLLTGSVPAAGHPSGKALADRFVAEQPWIGERLFGGARAIPLRRPVARPVREHVILLGDAGYHVFSAHGSGIGAQLVAASELADALAGHDAADGWAVRWMRSWGGLLASYDVFRRFSQTLAVPDIEHLITAGVMDEATTRAALAQQAPPLTPRLLGRQAAGAARAPRLVARMAPVLARMGAVKQAYARYPRDPRRVDAWARLVRALAADGVDG